MDNFDLRKYLKNNKLLFENKTPDSPETGGHREESPKTKGYLRSKSEKIAKLANNNGFALEMDIQELLPDERINYMINNFSDQEINNLYNEWFGDDMNENRISKMVNKVLNEMSISGGEATMSPGTGEQYSTKLAFKKKKNVKK